MREILLNYGLFITWGIALLEIIITVVLFTDFDKKRDLLILNMALVAMGLAYDALIIGIGVVVPLPILEILSKVRFIGHGVLVPLNLIICTLAIPLPNSVEKVVIALTVLCALAGGAAGALREIDEIEFAGILRFVSVMPSDHWTELVSKGLSFGTVIPIILAGIAVIFTQKSPSILLAGLLMFGFSAVGPATGNTDLIFLFSMFGEVFMILFYMIYEKRHT